MRDQKALSVRTVVAIGIGTAILFILKRFAVIPTGIANTNIDISYGFLGFIATLFGPIAGFFIGFLGHALNDFTQYGTPWWTWVFTTGLVGMVIGLFWRRFNVEAGNFGMKKIVSFNLLQIITNVVSWSLIAHWIFGFTVSRPIKFMSKGSCQLSQIVLRQVLLAPFCWSLMQLHARGLAV